MLNAQQKFKATPVGEIPVDWECVPLDKIASISSGGTPSKSNKAFWNGDVPWLSAKDLKTFYLKDSIDHISDDAIEAGAKKFPENSIIVLVRGMTLLKKFPVGILTREMAINQDLKSIHASTQHCDAFFLANYLDIKSDRIRSFVTIAGHGTGRLPLEALSSLSIPLPPLAEQKKIADILGTWDRAIDTQQKLITALTQRKKALAQQLLTGKTRLPGFEEPWKEAKLSELLKFEPRETPKPQEPFLSAGLRSHGKGVFLKPDFEPASIALESLFMIREGDLMVNITFAWEGAIAIVPPEADKALTSHRFSTYTYQETLVQGYLEALIKSKRFVFECILASPGGAGRNRVLKKTDFLKIKIPLPPLSEQTAIAKILTTADRELALHTQHLTTLQTQKRALMQQLLTGKVRVAN